MSGVGCSCGADVIPGSIHAPHCDSNDPQNPCALCKGEGAIGTGYGSSFVDPSDAMQCPQCGGTGEST